MFRLTPAVKTLLIINVVVFLLPQLLRLQDFFGDTFALYYIQGDMFKPWQFITYMFLHADFSHLFHNMLGLFVFGPLLEDVVGTRKFYAFYLIVGLGAGMLFMGTEYLEKRDLEQSVDLFLQEPDAEEYEVLVSTEFAEQYDVLAPLVDGYRKNPASEQYKSEAVNSVYILFDRYLNSAMVGASGAVFGILLAVGLLFPFRQIYLLFIPFPIRIRLLVIFFAATEIYSIIQARPNDPVAHIAHLGGMLVGYLVLLNWGIARNRYQ